MLNQFAGLGGSGFSVRYAGLLAALVCVLTPVDMAAAAEATQFATVSRVQGDVSAVAVKTGKKRQLKKGDAVYVGERVTSSAVSEALLKTEDAGMVAVRPNAAFVIEGFAAEGKLTDNFAVRLLTGSLRMVTGWIGKLNRPQHVVLTPTSTIGIRGTDHETYVLSAEMAKATSNKEGTYDKVNRGGTTMAAGNTTLDIDVGRVGFARAGVPSKDRAMMTLLLPVLLDKVPNFYVPGRFDADLDAYSATADEQSQNMLEQKQGGRAITPVAGCSPPALATAWLAQLDGAIGRGDAPTVLALFAPDVSIRVTARDGDGKNTTLMLNRDELVQSTLAAMKDLKDYKQRRISTEAKLAEGRDAAPCQQIGVKSLVIEQGIQAGKPYRFESLEEYLLVLREGKWLASKAESTQR